VITAAIVVTSMVLAVAFSAAWLLRPGLRARIERPKHEFQERLRHYDRARMTGSRTTASSGAPRR
jgi:hypothetical protein